MFFSSAGRDQIFQAKRKMEAQDKAQAKSLKAAGRRVTETRGDRKP